MCFCKGKRAWHHHAWHGVEHFKSRFVNLKPTIFPLRSFPLLTESHPPPGWLFPTQRPMGIQQLGLTDRRIILVMAQFVTVQSSRPLNTFKHVRSSKKGEPRNLCVHVICHRTLDDSIRGQLLHRPAMHVCIYTQTITNDGRWWRPVHSLAILKGSQSGISDAFFFFFFGLVTGHVPARERRGL